MLKQNLVLMFYIFVISYEPAIDNKIKINYVNIRLRHSFGHMLLRHLRHLDLTLSGE